MYLCGGEWVEEVRREVMGDVWVDGSVGRCSCESIVRGI